MRANDQSDWHTLAEAQPSIGELVHAVLTREEANKSLPTALNYYFWLKDPSCDEPGFYHSIPDAHPPQKVECVMWRHLDVGDPVTATWPEYVRYCERKMRQSESEMSPIRKLAIDIIELFEDLLEKHNIIIPDEARLKDDDTPIYGAAYYELENAITNLLEGLVSA